MAKVPKKVAECLANGLKRFQPILNDARKRDINESDTSVIVADMLAYMFGYDKYAEITSEYAIRSTYCDLAIKIDGQLNPDPVLMGRLGRQRLRQTTTRCVRGIVEPFVILNLRAGTPEVAGFRNAPARTQ